MNGKCAKRIRRAAFKVICHAQDHEKIAPKFRDAYKKLKREYKILPYHCRKFSYSKFNKGHRTENQRSLSRRFWKEAINNKNG